MVGKDARRGRMLRWLRGWEWGKSEDDGYQRVSGRMYVRDGSAREG